MSQRPPRRTLLILSALSLLLTTGGRPSATAVRALPKPVQPSARNVRQEDGSRRARALLELSERQNLKDHPLALQTASQALSLFQAAGDTEGVARAYALVARCQMAQSDLPEASQNYASALRLWRELNRTREQVSVLISLGFIAARQGEWQSAITLFSQAQELGGSLNEPTELGRIAGGLGYVFNENGLPEKGLVQYQKALGYFQQTSNARDIALTVLEIGRAHYFLGHYPEALAHFQQALAAHPSDSPDAADCRYHLGMVYESLGNYTTALDNLQATIPVYERAGNFRDAADSVALIGQIYERQGRLDSARQQYQRALETFTRVSDQINRAAVLYALGRLELKARNYPAAEELLQGSVEVTENLRRVPTSSDLTAAFSATVHDRYESYVECLMRQRESEPARGLEARAFEISELARARSLAELLRGTQTSLVGGIDPTLAQREKLLRQKLRVKEDSKVALLGGEYKTEELAALDAELARLEADYKTVEEEITARYPAYGQVTHSAAADLRTIQEQVVADNQTVLLEYLLGEERSYVWAVTRDGIRSYELPARPRFDEAAREAYKYISAPPGADSETVETDALRDLSRMVLSPVVAELLGKSRVIVVGDGALNYIPFQVLPLPSTGEPLVANYEVVNAPSASILKELREEAARRRPAAKLLAAFGNPVFASNYAQSREAEGGAEVAALRMRDDSRQQPVSRDIEVSGDSFDPSNIQPLFYANRELSNLLGVAAGRETFVATGFSATRERLLGTDLSQYSILHFATHGLLDPKRPENSGLVLSTVAADGRAQDGFVGLNNIYELRAPVNLVVLSACRTALGKDVRGEGLLGLTRGFMYAGASSVVSSLWKVDDEATAELMGEFYSNMLRKGETPAEALRAAQNSIRSKPEWRSPYYWAAFTLQGEYRQVINPPAAAWYPKVAAGALLLTLLAFGGWWYRRQRKRNGVEDAATLP